MSKVAYPVDAQARLQRFAFHRRDGGRRHRSAS
jgi:hypothetical protein